MEGDEKPTGHDRCGADRDGNICKQPAGFGTDHVGVGRCKFHLGCTPTHQRAASVEIARRACVALSIPIEIDPGTALLDELYRSRGWIATYEAMVNELGDTSELYGDTYHVSGIATGEAKPHVTVELLFRERQHYKAVAREAVHAGVEVRLVQLQERQVDLAQRAFEAMLEDLGLDQARRQEARQSYAQHLRLVK